MIKILYCNQCGGQLKDTANFCKYCGAKIKKQPESEVQSKPSVSTQSIPRSESLFNQAIMSEKKIEQGLRAPSFIEENVVKDPFLLSEQEHFDPITDEIIDVLYSREREVDIKEELKEILSEVEKISQRLNIGIVSKDEAADQIKDKQDLISALKAERKSLKIEKIALETLSVELKELQDKLDKLHIMYNEGKITHETIYTKLKKEYSDSYDLKKADYDKQLSNMVNWLKILEFDVQKMKEDIDILKVKANLGEINTGEAEKKQMELEIDIYRKELAYHALKNVSDSITK